MHQSVTEVVQVQTFASHIGAQHDPYRIIEATESLDQILLIGVGHLSVEHFDLIGLELQVPDELLLQPAERLDSL